MAAFKSVIVLTPNGRRHTVKVTPNTTLLQILEDACAKYGFDSKDYDLKHHNKIVDVDNVIRFTGLPNNALLEMVPATKVRKDTEVFIGVQIESGERFTGTFMPSENLWTLLNKLCPDEVSKEGNPVAIYTRTEVSGRSNLEKTNLRSLGITGGRAMIRFIHRSPEELRGQANVSAPLNRPSSKQKALDDEYEAENNSVGGTKTKQSEMKLNVDAENLGKTSANMSVEPKDRSPLHQERPTSALDQETKSGNYLSKDEEMVLMDESNHNSGSEKGNFQGTETKIESGVPADVEPMEYTDNVMNRTTLCKKRDDTQPEDVSVPMVEEEEEEIILLPGEHSGCVFSVDSAQSTSAKSMAKDLPDDFFEVTLEDARVLLRDLKRRRAELEDAPLITSSLRRQQEMHLLTMPCVLRIMFPNRTVLQGCFVGSETVGDVKNFVQGYLENPELSFHLYISPPKTILKPESFIYEVDGFPTFLVYFAFDKSSTSDDSEQLSEITKKKYLRDDVLSKMISQTSATKVARRSRGIVFDTRNNNTARSESVTQPIFNASEQPSTSTGRQVQGSQESYINKPVLQTSVDQFPKWFRTNK